MVLGLSACDRQHPESTQQAQTQPSHEADEQSVVAEGMSLTKVAGQASLPYSGTPVRNLTQPSEASLAYVGRYHARIPCTDPLRVVSIMKMRRSIFSICLKMVLCIGPIPVLAV